VLSLPRRGEYGRLTILTFSHDSEEFDFAPHQSPDELNEYKFMFDIVCRVSDLVGHRSRLLIAFCTQDGNGWSARFRRLMTTNSVVLKTGMFTEWFQAHIVPYVSQAVSKSWRHV
jgi:beta-1,2-xylosyltransferase